MQIIAKNKRAHFDYDILDTFEAGMELLGSEVKSVRKGNISLSGAFISLRTNPNGHPEFFLTGAHISPYQKHHTPYEPERARKLLLGKKEIASLIGKKQTQGLTLVPISVYNTTRHRLKLQFAVARGKRKIDKRETIKRRETEREMRQKMAQSWG